MFVISKLSVKEISLVDEPAVPKAKILLVKDKNNDEPNKIVFVKSIDMKKTNDVEKKVFGYSLVPDETDLHGHTITKEEIKKAVDTYHENLSENKKKGTGIGLFHKNFGNVGRPILNVYDETGDWSRAAGIPENEIIKGAWLTGIQLTDESFELYKEGKINGFSIGGEGNLDYVNDGNIQKSITSQSLPKWLPQFYKKMKALLDEEVGNLHEDIKDWMIRNTIGNILIETEYQIYSAMSTETTSDDFWNFEMSAKKEEPKENITNIQKKKEKKGFFEKLFKSKHEREGNNLNREEAKELIKNLVKEELKPLSEDISSVKELLKSLSIKKEEPKPIKAETSTSTQTQPETATQPSIAEDVKTLQKENDATKKENTELKKTIEKMMGDIETLKKAKNLPTQMDVSLNQEKTQAEIIKSAVIGGK